MADWHETLKAIKQQLLEQEAARKRLAAEAAQQGHLPDVRGGGQTAQPPPRPSPRPSSTTRVDRPPPTPSRASAPIRSSAPAVRRAPSVQAKPLPSGQRRPQPPASPQRTPETRRGVGPAASTASLKIT